jgi:hypothetical protein
MAPEKQKEQIERIIEKIKKEALEIANRPNVGRIEWSRRLKQFEASKTSFRKQLEEAERVGNLEKIDHYKEQLRLNQMDLEEAIWFVKHLPN